MSQIQLDLPIYNECFELTQDENDLTKIIMVSGNKLPTDAVVITDKGGEIPNRPE